MTTATPAPSASGRSPAEAKTNTYLVAPPERALPLRDWVLVLTEGETIADAMRPEFFGRRAPSLGSGADFARLLIEIGREAAAR